RNEAKANAKRRRAAGLDYVPTPAPLQLPDGAILTKAFEEHIRQESMFVPWFRMSRLVIALAPWRHIPELHSEINEDDCFLHKDVRCIVLGACRVAGH